MKSVKWGVIIVGSVLIGLAPSVQAEYTLSGGSLESGGGDSQGGDFRVFGSLRQIGGDPMAGGTYAVTNGFSSAQPTAPGDLNRDGHVTAADVNGFLRVYLGLDPTNSTVLDAGDVRPKPGINGRAYGDGNFQSDDLNWIIRRFLNLETAP